MDHVVLGDECIVGALSFIKEGEKFPRRSLIVGNPARILRKVSDEMIDWKTKGTALYQLLPSQCQESLEPCEPDTKRVKGRNKTKTVYESWKKQKR
jgi:phenylacetic acid degradation protein/carnitine operon protein CaiE